MKNLILSFLSIGLLFAMSCGSDDAGPKNNAPDAFTVSAENIGITTVDLNWTAPEDADGDDVSYEIKFDGALAISVAASPAGTMITSSISSLTPSTPYSGVVTAEDGKGGNTDASFSFTTQAAAKGRN